MYHTLVSKLILLSVIGTLFLGCASVPVVGRKQLVLFPNSEINAQSSLAYNEFMSSNKKSTNMTQTARIQAIGKRIVAAVDSYLAQEGLSDRTAGYSWEFNLVQSKEINAWCMPGGKVVFYEGILPLCSNDDQIAVVMSHEIAHAVANHSNERMSQQALIQTGTQILNTTMSSKNELTKAIINQAVGLGSQYGVILPFSRKHEYEADKLGIIFMTLAGYNANEAINFWEKMTNQNTGTKPPEFMSTHPSDANRIAHIKEVLTTLNKYKH